MRRFIKSLPGRLVCHVVAVALVAPFTVLASMRTADAQGIVDDVRWAVVDFVDKSTKDTTMTSGTEAAERVQDELSKFRETARQADRFDLVPRDQVTRAVETLNLTQPITDTTSLLRLAQEVTASRIVVGEIIGKKINNVNGGKQAVVGVIIRVLDAASGLAVNGASVEGKSSVRAGTADDKVIIGEALSTAAATAVPNLVKRQLTAAVLNTRGDEALINGGTRDGFKAGQNVVVLRGPRGRETQVATARLNSVDIDSGTIRTTNSIKGISPGDKVAVIWEGPGLVPVAAVGGGTGYREAKQPRKMNVGAAISVLLIIGLVAIIMSGGRGNNNVAADSVKAESTLTAGGSGEAAVEVSWRLDLFFRGNQAQQWLIYRDDVFAVPIGITDGTITRFVDTPAQRTFTYFNNTDDISTLVCNGLGSATTTQNGLIVGRPHTYSVRAVYRINQLDLPTGATGVTGTNATGTNATGGTGTNATGGTGTNATGGTGTNATGGTGTNATGGTGNTGTNGGGTFCYYRTNSAAAAGSATALNRATLLSPSTNETVTNFRNFTFTSVATVAFPIRVGYIIQICKSPTFNNGRVSTTPERIASGTVGQSIAFTQRFPGDSWVQFLNDTVGPKNNATDTQVWWRVGARNIEDVPGPKPDAATGLRYVFSAPQVFNRP